MCLGAHRPGSISGRTAIKRAAGRGGDFGVAPVANLYLQRAAQALCYDRIGAALYFSALGMVSVSLLPPCVGLSWFVTFWPICKEFNPSQKLAEICHSVFCSEFSGGFASGAESNQQRNRLREVS
jgi:hypothetical protein